MNLLSVSFVIKWIIHTENNNQLVINNIMKKIISLIKKIYLYVKPLTDKAKHDNVYAIAGQSAFYFILAFVPLVMFAVSVLQNINIPVETLQSFLGTVLNEKATQYMSDFICNMYSDTASISIITLIITLWSSAKGIHAIINGLNRVHNTYESRNWFLLRIRAMIITFALVMIFILTLAVFVLGSTLNEFMTPYIKHLPEFVAFLYSLRYLFIYIYLIIIFALMYRSVPNLEKSVRKEYGFMTQLPGAIISATAWFVLSVGISIYVDDFGGFSIYGGLTRLAVIMVWLYICFEILMYGAEINYVYHDKIVKILSRRHLVKNKA